MYILTMTTPNGSVYFAGDITKHSLMDKKTRHKSRATRFSIEELQEYDGDWLKYGLKVELL